MDFYAMKGAIEAILQELRVKDVTFRIGSGLPEELFHQAEELPMAAAIEQLLQEAVPFFFGKIQEIPDVVGVMKELELQRRKMKGGNIRFREIFF